MPTHKVHHVREVTLPKTGRVVRFRHRDDLRSKHPRRKASTTGWPAATLPVGWTTPGDGIIPIDGNDSLGDCGPCMAAHGDNVMTWRATGTASVMADLNAFENQYESVSGGDNGTDEDEMTGQIWAPPTGIAGITPTTPVPPVIYDHLDIPNDPAIIQSAIDNFGVVCMAFSVPDKWINEFDDNDSTIWDAPATPNPMNGHFVPLLGTLANLSDLLATWGSTVEITEAGMQVCEASLFTVFSPRLFNPATGLAPNGMTYDQLAALWQSLGGATLPPSPFAVNPTPGPTPTPPTPTPAPPAPTPSPDTVVTVDLTAKTVTVPTGWKQRPSPIAAITIHPAIQAVNVPGGYSAS